MTKLSTIFWIFCNTWFSTGHSPNETAQQQNIQSVYFPACEIPKTHKNSSVSSWERQYFEMQLSFLYSHKCLLYLSALTNFWLLSRPTDINFSADDILSNMKL